ncbi:epoxide hydrolase family protein [Kineococcus sp. SYSU DK006]|uniref:epoxide hydrolase family protein n=1 Tax=Kineococcus sp. SYSU DK006 TaxID=3383127 RepID=UPI003D7CD2A8
MSAPSSQSVHPFRIEVAQADLEDLRERLTRTRLPQPAPGDSWDYGTPNSYLAAGIEHWLERYDWREQEERLNDLPRFRTEVDGQLLHFVHVQSPHPGATPLLLAHSYPGSSAEFVDLIGPLTDPVAHGGRAQDAFSVVVPDAPGYGFSQPVTQAGWSTARTARAYDTLMRRLGYEGYGVHGSDRGAVLARELGVMAPEGFLGLHVLQLFSFPSGDPAEMEHLGPEDFAALAHAQWFQSVGGYNAMNASRPQTVAVGLSDSPAALLAYSELFESFGNGTSLVPLDRVLTAVSIAWFTNAAAGMSRSYLEDARAEAGSAVNGSPTGVAVFADDFQSIRTFAERDNSDIRRWSTFERGGHYACLEVPDVLADDVRAFFAGLREEGS